MLGEHEQSGHDTRCYPDPDYPDRGFHSDLNPGANPGAITRTAILCHHPLDQTSIYLCKNDVRPMNTIPQID